MMIKQRSAEYIYKPEDVPRHPEPEYSDYSVRHNILTNYAVLAILTALLLVSVSWNAYLSVNQTKLSERISALDVSQQRLVGEISHKHVGFMDVDSTANSLDEVFGGRLRRDVAVSRQETSKKETRRRRQQRIAGAHFVAHYDSDRALREMAEGLSPSIGIMTDHGLNPKEQIYNIWKPMNWNNKKLFRYNATSGKVKVRSRGLYLIYSQMLFHSPASRRSYGIHINDETKPFVEALAYEYSHFSNPRQKRNVNNQGLVDSYAGIERTSEFNHTEHSAGKQFRHKRSPSAIYSQCSTTAVAYLKKNDQIFLKSLEFSSIIIPKPYLTFWGLVKL